MFARPTLHAPWKPWRVLRLLVATPLAAGLGACDFPTELPKWDTTWVVPGEATTISVARLLPGSVQVAPGGTAFVLDLPAITFARTLGQMCGASCAAFQGQTVPKPPFAAEFSGTIALPNDVLGARLAGGSLRVQLSHTFSFDPIRPSATARGFILITATSGNATLARDSISGETTEFGPGTTLNRALAISAASVTGPITVTVRVVSPAGDPVTVNTSQGISVSVTPSQVRVSEAQVRVANRTVTGERVTLELDVDPGIADRVKSGALLLDVENPFSVTGTLSLTINAPNTSITKQIALQQGTNAVRVDFNQSEIRSILRDSPAQLSVSGTITAPASGTVVRPSQVVAIRSRFQFTFGPDEN